MSWGGRNDFYGWAPRKSVAQRRDEAERMLRDAAKKGRPLAPIVIEGKKIATTFWGKAWCDNLERYRDFAYRLERGRSYVRSGSVIDLAITPGRINAKVLGSAVYDVAIECEAVTPDTWRGIKRDCAGSIGSLVDLLAGKLSESVMSRLCAEQTGLFPTPNAIALECSCPDYATMCKHVAAVMYGIGARLDREPELLFTLRNVSAGDLLASVAHDLPSARKRPKSARVLGSDVGLSALFGIDIVDLPAPTAKTRSNAKMSATSPTRTKIKTKTKTKMKASAESSTAKRR
jgi:uncharacterized Zn finger protein